MAVTVSAPWQPQEEGLKEICGLLEQQISPSSLVDKSQIWQQLQHYSQFPDFNNYLVFILARAEDLMLSKLKGVLVYVGPAHDQPLEYFSRFGLFMVGFRTKIMHRVFLLGILISIDILVRWMRNRSTAHDLRTVRCDPKRGTNVFQSFQNRDSVQTLGLDGVLTPRQSVGRWMPWRLWVSSSVKEEFEGEEMGERRGRFKPEEDNELDKTNLGSGRSSSPTERVCVG
ncbi:hypothetical protein F3Y22_tig00110944pilonHSYRG00068 [Hibiscus syriacus]|uniref:Uncharacterized protein n=1 Tax=Hibiscus syriacus TaxID=106335 RepID=A0A6A2ZBF4_HIBSY|nr:hypothetical protein F3Y22_tig00110944pilonHSYRG00068 [Hibiscus syriacus]